MSSEERLIRAVSTISSAVLGFVFACVSGLALFGATLWLVLKGGENVGPHLALLGQFLPGYSVTLRGSFIGLAYGLALGFLVGGSIGWLYNRFTTLGHREQAVR